MILHNRLFLLSFFSISTFIVSGISPQLALAGGAPNCGVSGDCFAVHKTPGCEDAACSQTVCDRNAFCCDDFGIWEQSCVDLALELCEEPGANDDCSSPTTVLEGLTPFSTFEATTDGPEHDLCDFSGTGQVFNDVWFEYVATDSGTLTIDTCGLVDYDSKIAVYLNPLACDDEALEDAIIGCNDDGDGGNCFMIGGGPFASRVFLQAVQDQTYLIRVGGFGPADFGSGELRISLLKGGCNTNCPGGSVQENEPCGSDTNGGCPVVVPDSDCCIAHENPGCDDPPCQAAVCDCDPFCCSVAWDDACAGDGSGGIPGCGAEVLCGDLCDPPSGGPGMFGSLQPGQTVCGTAWAAGNVRDTDWFTLNLSSASGPVHITWSVSAEFPVSSAILGDDCNDLIVHAVGSGLCPTVATACVEPGIYRLFVAVNAFQGFPCGSTNAYRATVTTQTNLPECDNNCFGNTELTQNASDAVMQGGLACNIGAFPGTTLANSFARSYNLANIPETAGEAFSVNCVQFGVVNTGPAITVAINLYRDTNGGPPTSPTLDLTLLGSQSIVIPAGTPPSLKQVSFDPPILVPPDSALVVELDAPAQPFGRLDYGANSAMQTAPTYILSADCNLPFYANVAAIGGANLNWVQRIFGDAGAAKGCSINASCPGDVNGDDLINGADLGALLLDFGTNGCPQGGADTLFATDLTGDENVSGADLGALLLGFGPCP